MGKTKWMALVAVGVAMAVVAMAVADDETEDIQILKRTGKAFTSVAKRALPAVVFIEVEKTVETGRAQLGESMNDPFGFFGDELFERYFGRPGAQQPRRRYKARGQ